jgi:carbon monoxide dehydrogenase subunit G
LTVRARLVAVSGSSCVIDYRGTHRFSVPPETVWAAIERSDEFEQWWAWLGDFHLDGPGLQRGSCMVGVVSPPLPYRMRIRVELEECVRPATIDAAVHGDLEGRAHVAFEPDGRGTLATAAWTIEMTQLPMRLAARFAHPVLRWGHDQVVAVTVAGFRRQVETPT